MGGVVFVGLFVVGFFRDGLLDEGLVLVVVGVIFGVLGVLMGWGCGSGIFVCIWVIGCVVVSFSRFSGDEYFCVFVFLVSRSDRLSVVVIIVVLVDI